MKHCLAVIRIGAYIGVFGMFVVIGACGHILFFMSQARLLKWIAFFAQWWARVTCLIFNIQIHIEGDANIKSGSWGRVLKVSLSRKPKSLIGLCSTGWPGWDGPSSPTGANAIK